MSVNNIDELKKNVSEYNLEVIKDLHDGIKGKIRMNAFATMHTAEHDEMMRVDNEFVKFSGAIYNTLKDINDRLTKIEQSK